MSARPCKVCGMSIEMIEGPNGKVIPAQKIRTVYRGVIEPNGDWKLHKQELPEAEAYYVSHFETCPQASQF
ncbi:MAG: hypothetical protein V3R16_02550 [Nitrospirales bacterium]